MLPVAFFFVALLYSIVGFGGGSTYLSLLALADISYDLFPKISLFCNLLVVSGGLYHFMKSGHLNKKLTFSLVLFSVPMAFMGGLIPLKEQMFLILLTSTLFLSGLRLLFVQGPKEGELNPPSKITVYFVGGVLGFLSGIVGLGGGIFLSPLMLNLKWARPKEVAATASAFIFLNSLSGLIGQTIKNPKFDFFSYWPLFLAVILGGQIGSRLTTRSKFSEHWVQKATGCLILMVCLQLFMKISNLN